MRTANFEVTRDGRGIVTLIFDTPKSRANVFTRRILEEFESHLESLALDRRVKALFIESSKEDIFIAGADINEIKAAGDAASIKSLVQKGQEIFTKLERLPFPSIAMIDGACLGGGLEMSLCCTYRIATSHSHTRIGLPEVNLGILPGFGGTQRLYPLVGFTKALELIVGAKRLRGEKALKLGVVDACVPRGYLGFKKEAFSLAILAGTLAHKIQGTRKGILWYEKISFLRAFIGRMVRKKVLAKTHGHYPAPLVVIRVLEESFGQSLEDGLQIEREAVTKLALTDISKNLIELFFISEELKRETFSASQPIEIQHSAVVGAGTMGSGIAWALNNQDINVRLKDVTTAGVAQAIATIHGIYEEIRKRGRLTRREIALKMDKITMATDSVGFEMTGILLEAVSEDIRLKQKVYEGFEEVLAPDAVIASNTSSLSISTLAAKLKYPARFVGMHFFNPVNRMPLVEVISGEKTDERTIATVVALGKRMGKVPIKVKESPGFLVNRILLPYLKEAADMFEAGEDIHKIDECLVAFGMPMGPLMLLDTVGVDIGAKVSEILYQAYGERMAIPHVLNGMVQAGWLGKKSGLGFYDHQQKRNQINEAIETLQNGQSSLDLQTIEDRAILIMLNEASRCLQEEVVANARYLDMAMVMGIGFPAFRGGLMRYGDATGIAQVVRKLERLQGEFGDRFAPCGLLISMASTNETFYGESV